MTVSIFHITAAGTSSGTTSSETSTVHRDKTITTSATPAVSPSARGTEKMSPNELISM